MGTTLVRVVCFYCGSDIPDGAPRTVIGGRWHCSYCTYAHDYPERAEKRPFRGFLVVRESSTEQQQLEITPPSLL